jgi:hypothetical protein
MDSELFNHNSNSKKQVIKSNNFNSKNEEKLQHSDHSKIECESEYSSLNLESHPLIETNNVIAHERDNLSSRGEKLIPSLVTQVNSTTPTTATKLINLRKKNGTTLIFQRKNCSQHSQQQQTQVDCSEYQELEIESFKKRQSLQRSYKSAVTNHVKSYKSRHHYSWYDPHHYSQQSIEEEFDNSVSTILYRFESLRLYCN